MKQLSYPRLLIQQLGFYTRRPAPNNLRGLMGLNLGYKSLTGDIYLDTETAEDLKVTVPDRHYAKVGFFGSIWRARDEVGSEFVGLPFRVRPFNLAVNHGDWPARPRSRNLEESWMSVLELEQSASIGSSFYTGGCVLSLEIPEAQEAALETTQQFTAYFLKGP